MRRYWWIVLAVVWLALIGAVVSTARTPTTYVGRTSLIVASNDRSPDQDAVLVQGYVAYFDDKSYQQQLQDEARVDPRTTVAAQAAAGSPILVITATAVDAAHAQADAIGVARAFRDDINRVHSQTVAAQLNTLNDQLDTAVARDSKADQVVIAGLQDRIRQLKDDQVNVLQELQSNGGVTVQPPSWFNNLLLGLVGGLVAGILAALALAKLSPRLRSGQEVADKLGLATLVELPGPRVRGSALLRERRLRKLANIVRARIGGPGVLAVTQAQEGIASWVVARELALESATQGYRTVLVRLGSGSESSGWRIGGTLPDQVKPTDARAALSRLRVGPVPGLSVLDLRPRHVGTASAVPAGQIAELLELEPLAGSFVVLEAPAVVDSAAGQAACLAAHATVLVLDPQHSRVPVAREAVDTLQQSGVVLLGAVVAPIGVDQAQSQHGQLDDVNGDRSATGGARDGSSPGGGDWSWWPAATRSTQTPPDWELPEREAQDAEAAEDATQNGSSSGTRAR